MNYVRDRTITNEIIIIKNFLIFNPLTHEQRFYAPQNLTILPF